jgi:hypothetical protein
MKDQTAPCDDASRQTRESRVHAVLDGARRLADRNDPLGIEARRALPGATGLSTASVELALSRYLETSIEADDMSKLVTRAGEAPRVHVVLSANVFTGVVRAVALAVAAAPSVVVRPSSREAALAPLLQRAIIEKTGDALFELTNALDPARGDHVHVYGRRETIAAITASCPPGVIVRGHGPGFGIAVIAGVSDMEVLAERLSWDIVAFDQRGCLSPRLAFVEGTLEQVERFASHLCVALDQREKEVPRGALSDQERRDRSLYRQALQAVGQHHEGATYAVGVDLAPRAVLLPPTGRHIHVARVTSTDEMMRLLAFYGGAITCVGIGEKSAHTADFTALARGARILLIGNMQCPPLDGPVDLREML